MNGEEERRGERSILARARPLVLARALSAVITFLIPLVLARTLAVEDYGGFKQFFLVSSTLYYALLLGVPQSLYYFLPRTPAPQQRAFVGQALLYLAGAGLLAAGAIYAGAPLLRLIGGEALIEFRGPLAITCAGTIGGAALEPALTARNQTSRAAFVYVASDLVRMVCMVAPIVGGAGLAGVLWGGAAFGSLRTIAAWSVVGIPGRGALVRPARFAQQLRYALPFGGAMLLAIPQQQFHQYAVSATVDPALFAVYAVGCFNLPIVDLLFTPTSELLMVRIGELARAGRPAEEAAAAFRGAVGQLAYLFIPISVGLFALAPTFLTLLYTERYAAAMPIFRVAVLMVLLACFPVEGVLRARARMRALFLSYLAKAVVSVPLVLLLLHSLGPIGAMIAFVGVEALHKGTLLVLSARTLVPSAAGRGPIRGTLLALAAIVPGQTLLRAGLCAVSAGLLASGGLQLASSTSLIVFAVLGLGFWAAYVGALRVAGLRPAALVAVLRR